MNMAVAGHDGDRYLLDQVTVYAIDEKGDVASDSQGIQVMGQA
jgi:hypothetical protein